MIDLGFRYINFNDPYNRCPLDTLRELTSKVMNYAKVHGLKDVYLDCIEDCRYADPENERYNVDIIFTGENDNLVRQRLLILRGEVLDGDMLHKHIGEYYGEVRRELCSD